MEPPFRNVLDILKRREEGFYPLPHKACVHILRSILKDKANSFFECVYKESSNKPIYAVENKVYFDNFSVCKAFHGHRKPLLKYKLSNISIKDIVDFHTIHAVSLPVTPIPTEEYRNTFYILTKESRLYITNQETGEKIRTIFIADDSVCKYRHVSFQNELDRIYVESSIYPRKANAPNVIFSVVAFQILPLKLMGCVEFTTEVFGKDLKLIDFHNDVLITLHGYNSENYRASIFDFDEILCPENRLFEAELDRLCPFGNGFIGHPPVGIPVNYKIKKLPPVLLRIGCTSDSIDFSPLPLVYILTAPKKSGLFEVYDVFTRKLIGTVGYAKNTLERYFDLEEDDIFTDIRDRIVYKNHEKILVYRIEEDERNTDQTTQKHQRSEKKLELQFELKFPKNEESERDKEEVDSCVERRVMPSRKSKLNLRNHLRSYAEWDKNQVITLHYNTNLEIFLVLATLPGQPMGTLLLYDAVSGELMLHFDTPFILKPENMYNVYMFYEHIFVVERKMDNGQYRIFAFQMSRESEHVDIES